MEYMSAREAAGKWGISLRYVQRLLHEGKIEGARKYGVSWMIPSECTGAGKARSFDADTPAGCGYSFFPILYLSEANEAQALERCRNESEKTLLKAQIAWFQTEYQLARELVTPMFTDSAEPFYRLGCMIVLALCALYSGDVNEWSRMVSMIENIDLPDDARAARELTLAVLNSSMHSSNTCPEWLEKGDYTALSPELFPVARYLYVKNLYIRWNEVDLITVVEPLLSECHRDKCDFACILLHILAAVAYNDLGKQVQSHEHLNAAVALAEPMNFITPFVDYYHTLSRVIDDCLKDSHPRLSAAVNKQGRIFWDEWAKMYNDIQNKPMVNGLTPRELEAARLMKRGLTTTEIAKRMGISKNSVKKYLNVAYEKMNVNKKSQLKTLIHT